MKLPTKIDLEAPGCKHTEAQTRISHDALHLFYTMDPYTLSQQLIINVLTILLNGQRNCSINLLVEYTV